MNAVTFAEYGGPEVLREQDVPVPEPGVGQVRIAVRAAAVNPLDWKLRSGAMRTVMPVTFPVTVGYEASGVVDAVGPEVTAFAPGDEVFGPAAGGAAAEFALLRRCARKPPALTWEAAAALPVAVETSARVFTLLGGVRPHQVWVIDGAAGGVGAVAVQLAVAKGARVIATASEANHVFLRALGAQPTTYGPGLEKRVEALAPKGVDRGFDVAGRGGVADLVKLTKNPKHVATIADFNAAVLGVHVTRDGDIAVPDALGEAVALIEDGRLQPPPTRSFAFAQAAEAHRLSEAGHVRGKLILVPATSEPDR